MARRGDGAWAGVGFGEGQPSCGRRFCEPAAVLVPPAVVKREPAIINTLLPAAAKNGNGNGNGAGPVSPEEAKVRQQPALREAGCR